MTSLLQQIKELVTSKQDLITETTEIEVFNITSNINFIDNIDPNNFNSISYTSLKYIEDSINLFVSQIGDLATTKQDKLTAGDNITIDENNVISSSGGGSSSFVGFRAVAINKGGITPPIGNISKYLDNTNTPPYSYDTNNLYNTTTGTFFPDRNGYWQMGFKFYNNGGESTTTQTNQLKLRRNGVELGPIFFAGNNAGQSEDATTTAFLFLGDEVYITHEGTPILFIFNNANNFFEARFVGV